MDKQHLSFCGERKWSSTNWKVLHPTRKLYKLRVTGMKIESEKTQLYGARYQVPGTVSVSSVHASMFVVEMKCNRWMFLCDVIYIFHQLRKVHYQIF